MEDENFSIYQEIRDMIEDRIIRAKFTIEDKKELIEMLKEDIEDIIT